MVKCFIVYCKSGYATCKDRVNKPLIYNHYIIHFEIIIIGYIKWLNLRKNVRWYKNENKCM